MKNIINYYYDFNILNLFSINNMYYFNIDNNNYFFMIYDRPLNEINSITSIYIELFNRKIVVNDIILNNNKQAITMVNNIPYILVREKCNNHPININDILYIQNNTLNISKDKILCRNDWIKLWSMKIDYYEEQMKDLLKKYKLLNESIDYYIGLGENAISYLVYNNIKINNIVLSHKRIDINKGTFDFYNPINFILDSRVRDFSEYIKNLFFNNRINFDTFKYYIDYMNFSRDEYILLMSRLLFPTYYFDIYDEIINNNLSEEKIKNVLDKSNDYITFLKSTFYYIIYNKKINIPYIEWIVK